MGRRGDDVPTHEWVVLGRLSERRRPARVVGKHLLEVFQSKECACQSPDVCTREEGSARDGKRPESTYARAGSSGEMVPSAHRER